MIKETMFGEAETWGYQISNDQTITTIIFAAIHNECHFCPPNCDCDNCSFNFYEENGVFTVRKTVQRSDAPLRVDIISDKCYNTDKFSDAMSTFIRIVEETRKEVIQDDDSRKG